MSTGDEVTYSPNVDALYQGDEGIGISTVGILTAGVTYTTPTSPLADGTKLFVAKINSNLIGLSTVRVGMGTTGTFVGLASEFRDSTTLLFNSTGTGQGHSFKTNYEQMMKYWLQ